MLLKQNKENEETLKGCIKHQTLDLENLQKQLNADPTTKTFKYIENFHKETGVFEGVFSLNNNKQTPKYLMQTI